MFRNDENKIVKFSFTIFKINVWYIYDFNIEVDKWKIEINMGLICQ